MDASTQFGSNVQTLERSNVRTSSSTKPTCEICGGPIRAHNIYDICDRNPRCKREKNRQRCHRYFIANHEKFLEYGRCCRAVSRDQLAEKQRQYYSRNREIIHERDSQRRAANREKIRERDAAYYAANREKIRERNVAYNAANREKLRKYYAGYRAANRAKIREGFKKINLRKRNRRALRGVTPKNKQRGHLSTNWFGGENTPCAVPGCHRMAGWRYPKRIKMNKTGFRCPVHRYVQLPPITEEDYEYQTPEEVRSSVA